MKKLVVALLVGTIWFSSGMQVDAAGPKDAGKAKHHAEHHVDEVLHLGDVVCKSCVERAG